MKKLVVLCGHVGSGKSTLAEKIIDQAPGFAFFDVFSKIKKYKDKNGTIAKELSNKAYQELYDEISKKDGDILLEIGVNHSDFNFKQLNKLKNKFDIKIFFCLLDHNECKRRVAERALKNPNRFIHPQMLEDKFKIDFPNLHKSLAEKYTLPYSFLNMCDSHRDEILNL
ncbi:MAG: ATP-binding protein [Patescibacteria group bacterium]|nr:ATP-binding protein [Patescibacteria group bacterium]